VRVSFDDGFDVATELLVIREKKRGVLTGCLLLIGVMCSGMFGSDLFRLMSLCFDCVPLY